MNSLVRLEMDAHWVQTQRVMGAVLIKTQEQSENDTRGGAVAILAPRLRTLRMRL